MPHSVHCVSKMPLKWTNFNNSWYTTCSRNLIPEACEFFLASKVWLHYLEKYKRPYFNDIYPCSDFVKLSATCVRFFLWILYYQKLWNLFSRLTIVLQCYDTYIHTYITICRACCVDSTEYLSNQRRWCCWLGHMTRKIVSEMTYNVSSWTLNPTMPIC